MADLDEKIAISQWLQFKSSAEHYEMLQDNAERGTHPDAPYFAIHWRSLAQHKRRQMKLILDNMPTREQRMARAA